MLRNMIRKLAVILLATVGVTTPIASHAQTDGPFPWSRYCSHLGQTKGSSAARTCNNFVGLIAGRSGVTEWAGRPLDFTYVGQHDIYVSYRIFKYRTDRSQCGRIMQIDNRRQLVNQDWGLRASYYTLKSC